MNKTIPMKANVGTAQVLPAVALFFDHILTTANRHKVTESGIIMAGKDGNAPIYSKQIVVACGPNAGVQVGDVVEIAPERFSVKMKAPKNDVGPNIKEVQVPLEVIDGLPYLFLSTRELKWIYNKGD